MSRQGVLADPVRFAVEARRLSGTVGVGVLGRLADVLVDTASEAVVEYQLSGERGADDKPYLRLSARGMLALRCQRCLEAVEWPVDIERVLQLVPVGAPIPDEELENEAFDAIEATADLDALALVEEELLLSLPIAPRHDSCEPPRPSGEVVKESPFAVLASLRRSGGPR